MGRFVSIRWLGMACYLLALAAPAALAEGPHSHHSVQDRRWVPVKPARRRGRDMDAQGSLSDHKFGELNATIEGTDPDTRTVNILVKWSGIGFTRHGDYIALYASGANPLASAPIKLKILPNATEGPNKGRFPGHKGSITFKVISRRTAYIALYIGGEPNWPEEKARSEPFSPFVDTAPLGGHLALGSRDGSPSMLIMWNSKEIDDPFVEWGTSPGGLTKQKGAFRSLTYKPYDMCDSEISPAAQFGWFEPGYHHSVLLDGLECGQQYFYTYGGDGGRSTVNSFTAPLCLGENSTSATKMIVFGDMGQSPYDGSSQHSWDFHDMGELPARNVTDLIARNVKEGDIVVHIGDISYAVGYLSEWDQFMHQIEPVATKVAWQTGIGNHEMGNSRSFFGPPSDSGGECGVPYNVRFPFGQPGVNPNSHHYRPWYSFNYGRAHVVVTSTEHNFTKGSVQHYWVERDLAAVDRSVTPWLIFTGHRPMYPDSSWAGDRNTSKMLREAYEYLFLEYNVDLCLWGHQHVYSRSCPIANGACVPEGKGPVHMTIGMAGYELSRGTLAHTPYTVVANNTHYGVISIEIPDRKTASIKFLTTDGAEVDEFTLTH